MHHYVYQVENVINHKIYVGKHSTADMNDGYMGSGTLLSKAIAKYGIENFRKTIIREFETEDEALLFEAQIVDENFVSRDDTYNLNLGGNGSWHAVNADTPEAVERHRRQARLGGFASWTNEDFRARSLERASRRGKQAVQEGTFKHVDWTGKKHSEESKRKIGDANSRRQSGKGNSQYGKVWLHHDTRRESIAVERSALEEYISCGWVVGRKMKW